MNKDIFAGVVTLGLIIGGIAYACGSGGGSGSGSGGSGSGGSGGAGSDGGSGSGSAGSGDSGGAGGQDFEPVPTPYAAKTSSVMYQFADPS